MLTLVYALLALAVLIALLGIANTLTLAIHERTRELGLLRAVGQTRSQLRAMVRWESVLVAAFGTVGGLALGGLPRLGARQGVRRRGRHRLRVRRTAAAARWWSRWSAWWPGRSRAGGRPGGRRAWTCCAPSPPSSTGAGRLSTPARAASPVRRRGSAGDGRPGRWPRVARTVRRVRRTGRQASLRTPSDTRGSATAGDGAESVNQTTLPGVALAAVRPSSRSPPRSARARGRRWRSARQSRTVGSRGSWSWTETVSRSSSSSISTVHILSGWACRWTLVSSSVTPSAAWSIRDRDASSAIAPRRFCGPDRSATAGPGAPPCSACLAG